MEKFANMMRAWVEVITLKGAIEGANRAADMLKFYEQSACYQYDEGWDGEKVLIFTGDDSISSMLKDAGRMRTDLVKEAAWQRMASEAFEYGWKFHDDSMNYARLMF